MDRGERVPGVLTCKNFNMVKMYSRLQQTKVNGSNPYKVSILKIGSLGEVGITFVWLW